MFGSSTSYSSYPLTESKRCLSNSRPHYLPETDSISETSLPSHSVASSADHLGSIVFMRWQLSACRLGQCLAFSAWSSVPYLWWLARVRNSLVSSASSGFLAPNCSWLVQRDFGCWWCGYFVATSLRDRERSREIRGEDSASGSQFWSRFVTHWFAWTHLKRPLKFSRA